MILKALRGMLRGGGHGAASMGRGAMGGADVVIDDVTRGMPGRRVGGMGGGGPTAIEDAAMGRQMGGARPAPLDDMFEAQQLRNALPQMQRELQMLMRDGGDPADIQGLQQSIAEVQQLLSRGGGAPY